MLLETECGETGGIFHADWLTCSPNPCRLPHVCCIAEDCILALDSECEQAGGVFHPEWDSCGPPNPCQPTPATPDTWGGLKDLYR